MPNRKFISSNRKLVSRNRKLGRISETDENLGPLGYIHTIHMPSMAENDEQEVGSYLRNGAS